MWLCLSLLAMAVLYRYGPGFRVLAPPWTWAGLGPAAFGLYMAAGSARAFQRRKTGLIPFQPATALVTDGFFQYSRNPMYLGMALFLLGVSMLLGTAENLLPVAAFALIIDRQYIRSEERFMQDAFGAEYLQYQARVRRWL